ncbi:MAG: ABC transporter ATP-binding protein [Alphaproteobacteria bacterium]|nr:ABC transporter ATP-binding protein [Alphaproteobacteria bacterium]
MALLQTVKLTTGYGDFQALFDVDIEVAQGQIVAVIGANGAGKSTLLKAVARLLPVDGGTVRFDGADISGLVASQAVRLGISLVPEGRRLFPSLSVEENLQIGGYSGRRGSWRLAEVYDLFPRLAERRRHMGTALSGGEQQMVAIGRALMSNPRLLLCDELSLGLAPIVIQDIYTALPRIRDAGTSLVIVEQDIAQAMRVADRVYCLQEGRITLTGRPAELSREAIHAAYFGA